MLKTNKWKIKIECEWEAWEKLNKENVIHLVKDSLPEALKEVEVNAETITIFSN